MSKKLFFAAKNLDWDDDAAIDAFAKEVWAASVQGFTKDPKAKHAIGDTDREHKGPQMHDEHSPDEIAASKLADLLGSNTDDIITALGGPCARRALKDRPALRARNGRRSLPPYLVSRSLVDHSIISEISAASNWECGLSW